MVEHLFRVRLDELAVVRVVCTNCQAAIEVATATLDLRGAQCKGCNSFMVESRDDRLAALGAAIRELTTTKAGHTQNYRVEFAVPIKSE